MAVGASIGTENESAVAARVRLRDRYDIIPFGPLTEFDTLSAAAFEVADQRSSGTKFFAHVQDPRRPARLSLVGPLRLMKNAHILTPVDYGVVFWPAAKRSVLAVIYERPAGGRLVATDSAETDPWSPEEVVQRLLQVLLPTLKSLSVESLSHRGIRPSNILFRDGGRRQPILGDCISGLPAADQPIAYETIESAMTMPAGRGGGSIANDLYALGVLVLYLLFGRPPGRDLSDAQLLEEKIRRGSYAALAGEARLPTAMMELIRGLLIDSAEERWTVTELDLWLQGRRLSPKVSSPLQRATRPIEIDGEDCSTTRGIARALARGGDYLAPLIRNRTLETWLQRTLVDKQAAEALSIAEADGSDSSLGGASYDAKLISRAAMALDPTAPIRYRRVSLMIDGLGGALALAMLEGTEVRTLAEIVLHRLPQFWCSRQAEQPPELNVFIREFDRLRRVLEDPRPGMGIERLVYELNPGLHCLSPLIEKHCIMSVDGLLPALDRAASEGKIEKQPVDRHIVAFIARRWRDRDDTLYTRLASPQMPTKLLGMLQLLVEVESGGRPQALPALAQVFGRQAQLLLGGFKNRRTRTRLLERLDTVLKAGRLTELLELFDSTAERQLDQQNFRLAQRQYREATRSMKEVQRSLEKLPESSLDTAGSITAMAAWSLAGLVFMVSLLIYGHR